MNKVFAAVWYSGIVPLFCTTTIPTTTTTTFETHESLSPPQSAKKAERGGTKAKQQQKRNQEASMEMLISEEMPKGPNTRRNVPSVVARLMGINMLSFDTKSVARQDGKKNQKPGTNLHKKEQNKKGSGGRVHCSSNSSRQMEFNSFQHNKDKDPDSQHVHTKLKKPRSREHPQEEELQKFKKEFEACQAARIRECSKVVELDRIPSQRLAQEALNKEKVALYSNSRRITASEKPIDFMGHAVKASPCEKNQKPGTNLHKKEQNKKGSGGHVHCNSNSSRQMEFNSFQHNKDNDPDSQHVHTKLKKPRSREHPQEEELQKFKKEFEACQAARIRECSKVVELERIPSQWLAQEALNKEKVALYSNSRRITASEKPIDFMGHAVKASPCEKNQKPGTNLHKKEQNKKGSGGHVHCNSNSSRQMEFNSFQHNKDKDPDSQHVHTKLKKPWSREHPQEEELRKFKKEFEACQAARIGECSKVVELDRIPSQWLAQEALNKEKVALYSNSRRITASEKPIDFMGHAVKTSPCESGLQHHGFRKELFPSEQKESYSSRNRTLIRDFEQPSLINSDQKLDISAAPTIRDLSPRSLIRSMSAPASSGTSFGKVLLEDCHILTGAQIRRKHEVVERVTVDVRKRKKERSNLKEKVSSLKHSFSLRGSLFGRKILSAGSLFGRKRKKERSNLKEKVSSLKYSFSLRGSLFGKKILSAEEPHKYECDSMKDIMSGPTVMLNFGEAHENFTEVPPSPASVCSSVYEELWRAADHFSSTSTSTSTSDLFSLEDVLLPQVFREISSNLNELPRQLNELDADGPKESVTEEQPLETEMAELEDEAEAYIRDLLVASGLYDGSSDNVLSRWDPLAKPITNDIFEAVEESYRKMTKDNEGSRSYRKLLLDLLNEALSVVLGPPVTMSTFRKAIGPALLPPRGQELLDRAWEIVHAHLYPPTDKFHYSIDDMVAEDLGFTTWSGLMNDEIDAVAKAMESRITRSLIEEIVKVMQSHNGA